MAINLNETAGITLQINGDKARNELALLEADARKLERALKEAPKGTQEWADLYKTLGQNADAQKKLREEIGTTGLTLSQLEKEQRAITKEMKEMTAGTEEYAAKSARLKEVNARITELRQDYKALAPDIDKVTASVADWDDENKRSTLTVKQLREVAAALAKEIDDLVPGTKEHTEAVQKQEAVSKQLNATTKQVTASVADWDDENKRATLTVKQLREVSDQLGKEIEQLIPGTKEHAAAVEKQNAVQKQLGTTLQDQPSKWKQIQTAVVAAVGAFSLISLAQEAFNLLKTAVAGAVTEFRGFEKSAQSLSAITGLTGKDLDYLKEQAREVGPAMGMTAKDMLEAYKLMGSAKPELLEQKEALAAITKEAITLAQAAEMELPDATKALAESLNQFGEGADQANRFINVMAAGAKEGSAEIKEVSSSLKASGTVAKAAGLSFEQTNAALQSMSSIALKGEQAGTMLRNVLLKLQSGAKETNPEFVGMEKALDNLAKQNLTTAEMAKLFGAENVVAAKHIVSHRNEISELTKKLTGTSEAISQANKNNQTYDQQVKKMQATVADLSLAFGQKLVPMLTKGAEGVITFINVMKALPEFVSENKEALAMLAVGLVTMNGHIILAEANTLRLAAAEKIATASKAASTTATNLLNAAMLANPVGVVIGAITLLVGAFVLLYQNSETVRASMNGFWQALKTVGSMVVEFHQALANLDFDAIKEMFTSGGKRIADAFNKGYADTLAQERPKQRADHQQHLDNKKGDANKTATDIATHEVGESKKALQEKAAAAKKAREEQAEEERKATEEVYKKRREANIEAIKDETEREQAKLLWKFEQEVVAVRNSKASEADKNATIAAMDAQLKTQLEELNKKHLDKVKADQKVALDLQRQYQIDLETDEKRRKELDAQFKFDKEKERITKEISEENGRAQILQQLETKLKQELAQINTDFRNQEREANQAVRQQEQAAEKALLDWKEVNAGTNAKKLEAIKKERLDLELRHTKQALADEQAAELARIEDSKLSNDQKTQAIKAVNDRYRAEEQNAIAQHHAKEIALEQERIARQTEMRQALSGAFKSLLAGDLMAFAQQSSSIVQGEKQAWQQRMSENESKYQMVGEIAQASVDFLNKQTQDRLDKEIAASKKETETKLADSKKRMEAAIKAAEDQAAKEKKEAQGAADKIKAIEEKLATQKTAIREEFEEEADDIRKSGAEKEKGLARQKWEADKRAQIATALITGALAALKALASGIFPVNLVFAGIIAGMTAIQIAKIKNQPAPAFADGGAGSFDEGGNYQPFMYGKGGSSTRSRSRSWFKNAGVLRGGRHGSRYGERGIAMVDRASGQEVGEAEDGEPFMILSRNTYRNNREVVDKLLYTSMYKGGKKIAYESGGVGYPAGFDDYGQRRMYLFGGGKKKREAEAAARAAEEEAAAAAKTAEMEAANVYDGATSGDEGDANGTAEANSATGEAAAQAEEAARMAQEQLDLLQGIIDAVDAMNEDLSEGMSTLIKEVKAALEINTTETKQSLSDLANTTKTSLDNSTNVMKTAIDNLAGTMKTSIDGMAGETRNLNGSINAVENATRGVEGATHQVKDAVYGTNNAGRLDAIVGAIGSLKG